MKITGWQTQQDNANRAWASLGAKLGFDWNTVELGTTEREFSAVVLKKTKRRGRNKRT